MIFPICQKVQKNAVTISKDLQGKELVLYISLIIVCIVFFLIGHRKIEAKNTYNYLGKS